MEPQPQALGDTKLRMACLIILALVPSLVSAMVITVLMPILPAIAEHYQGRGGMLLAQYVMAIPGIGIVVGAMIGGQCVDRFGCRWVMIFALILYAISGLATPYSEDARGVLAARFFLGSASGAFYAAATALVGQVWQGETRTKILGYVTAAAAVIAIPTVVASGAVAEKFGWQASFWFYGISLPFILPCFAVPAGIRRVQTAVARATWSEWRGVVMVYVRALPVYIVVFVPLTQFSLLLAEEGIDPAKRSMILAVPSVFAFVTSFFFARIARILDRRQILFLVLFGYGAGVALLGLGTPAIPVCLLLIGIATGACHPYFVREVLAEAPLHIQGRASGGIISVHYAAQFFNPLVVGTLATIVGLKTAMMITGGALLFWLVVEAAWGSKAAPAQA